MNYDAKFEIDIGLDYDVYLNSLDKIRDATIIGSLDPKQFIPILFCVENIRTITMIRYEDNEFLQEDLIELAAFAEWCNKEAES